MVTYIFALLLSSLALWFLISATRISSAVHEVCHPIGGELWSLFIVMLVAYGFSVFFVYLHCGGSTDPSDLVATFSNADDAEVITPGQCYMSTALAMFMMFSVPIMGYSFSTFFFDPVEPTLLIELYENSTITNGTASVSLEHGPECLVRSRRPGVYIVFAILLLYMALGMIALAKCMWFTRQRRIARGELSDSDSDEAPASDDDSANLCPRCQREGLTTM